MEPNPELPAVAAPRPIRLWPGLLAVGAYWLGALLCRIAAPGTLSEFYVRYYGPMAAGAATALWWLALSRTPRSERLLVAAAAIVSAVGIGLVADRTITFPVLVTFVAPIAMTVWIASALVFTVVVPRSVRRWGISTCLLLVGAAACLVRFEGIVSGLTGSVSARWSKTSEERFLESQNPAATAARSPRDAIDPSEESPLHAQSGDWPEFRGPRRDGIVEGVRLVPDWKTHPPREKWRRRIGPAWSSFIVVAGRLFTQEQRGEQELVSCYDAATGDEIWTFADSTRFNDPVTGPGPRATPTFHEGRLYAFGATGRLHCLEARTGSRVWTRDIRADAGEPNPQYGFASAPLVADGLATVFAGGEPGFSVVATRIESGVPAWAAGEGNVGYCAIRRETFDGVAQYLCSSNAGVAACEPETGRALWSHSWPVDKQARIVQPCRVDDTHVLIGTGLNDGLRLLEVTRSDDAWTTREIWTSNQLKPYYNDFVLHEGTIYGYDGALLSAFDLQSGRRAWRKRGYDSGQLLLLRDQGLLIALTESGMLALLEVDPAGPSDLGAIQAFSGKSWSHPVIAHGRLYVRNAEEAVCYELATEPAGTTPTTATTAPAEQP